MRNMLRPVSTKADRPLLLRCTPPHSLGGPQWECRLSVAEPIEMIGTDDPMKWSSVRIATKYPELTRMHFAARGVQAECIKLNGALELAPHLGLCKRIVDLVATGETLKANGLIEIEEIQKVSTRLAINKGAYKTNLNDMKKIIDKFDAYLNEQK